MSEGLKGTNSVFRGLGRTDRRGGIQEGGFYLSISHKRMERGKAIPSPIKKEKNRGNSRKNRRKKKREE